jgi:hypothetical protein
VIIKPQINKKISQPGSFIKAQNIDQQAQFNVCMLFIKRTGMEKHVSADKHF